MEMNYIDMYKKMHQDPNLYTGSATILHAEKIQNLINIHDAKTLLDYGCGKAMQYKNLKLHEKYFNGILPALYDPAVEEYSELPNYKFDGVICTDVLEHIPEKELSKYILEILDRSNKFVYFGICNIKADSFLPNGENSHVTIKTFDQWVDFIFPYILDKYAMVYVYGIKRGTCIINGNQILLKKEL